MEDCVTFSWLLTRSAGCLNVILRSEYPPFIDGENRVQIHAIALKLYETQDYGYQWCIFDDNAGYIPIYSQAYNGDVSPNYNEVLWNFLHGAIKVTVYAPRITVSSPTNFNVHQFANFVDVKMEVHNYLALREPLGKAVKYGQQKEALKNQSFFTTLQSKID